MIAFLCFFMLLCVQSHGEWFFEGEIYETNCSTDLNLGQYLCSAPEIDEITQQPKDCSKENKATSK